MAMHIRMYLWSPDGPVPYGPSTASETADTPRWQYAVHQRELMVPHPAAPPGGMQATDAVWCPPGTKHSKALDAHQEEFVQKYQESPHEDRAQSDGQALHSVNVNELRYQATLQRTTPAHDSSSTDHRLPEDEHLPAVPSSEQSSSSVANLSVTQTENRSARRTRRKVTVHKRVYKNELTDKIKDACDICSDPSVKTACIKDIGQVSCKYVTVAYNPHDSVSPFRISSLPHSFPVLIVVSPKAMPQEGPGMPLLLEA
ncbi:hypothetical protein OBBRIDRAFT_795031 [Obba rivulosa]|uniref:Uncharacterized protein n=1 Tax=Obba rivulosa TaxID=1052685 RepID=A0A8E2DIV0_9APHY|nr:hypothetical protein OBBRIDRAFT_795031 [Obba rivulosa]